MPDETSPRRASRTDRRIVIGLGVAVALGIAGFLIYRTLTTPRVSVVSVFYSPDGKYALVVTEQMPPFPRFNFHYTFSFEYLGERVDRRPVTPEERANRGSRGRTVTGSQYVIDADSVRHTGFSASWDAAGVTVSDLDGHMKVRGELLQTREHHAAEQRWSAIETDR